MVRKQFLFFFLTLAFISLAVVGQYHILPTNALFELLVLCTFLFVAKRMCPSAWLIFCCCIVYLIVTLALAKVRGVHPVDYFIAYKAFFYIAILCFFSSKVLFQETLLRRFWYVLLALFFIKYVIWIALRQEGRPGIFTENNYEIMFLLLLGCAIWSFTRSLKMTDWMALATVTFLSGSRSGVICFLAMFTVFYIKDFGWKTVLKLLVVAIIAAGVVATFISRLSGGDLEAIDRVVFFQGFLQAISDWGWQEYLIGSQTLTPMPESVCNRLQYYQSLFSAGKPGVCYSLVLHTYLTRVVFDHGFLGLIFIFVSINQLLKLSDIAPRARLAAFSIVFLNGASVSSINSVYAVVGLIILMTGLYPERLVASRLTSNSEEKIK
ncbi:hypothetical protein ACSLBF_15020 [Pseudoalteromonas sp. T1lg65]|uniref:hypothetical protein n=1 Tax=Pseudoalteromonas sp. T1lg65 TaxID=2077101 RepID=UPI003F79198B